MNPEIKIGRRVSYESRSGRQYGVVSGFAGGGKFVVKTERSVAVVLGKNLMFVTKPNKPNKERKR